MDAFKCVGEVVGQGSAAVIVRVPGRAVAYCAYMGDDWRVRIAFGVLPRGRRAFRQALIPAVGSRLGDQVTVSSSKTQIFVYAPSIGLADQAAQVARELLALHGINARILTEFWSLREQQWQDADDPSAGPAAQRPADLSRGPAARGPPGSRAEKVGDDRRSRLAGAHRSAVTPRRDSAGRASCRPGLAGPATPQVCHRLGELRRRRQGPG